MARQFNIQYKNNIKPRAYGKTISPGIATGKITFSVEKAIELSKNYPVILVKEEFDPRDILGIFCSQGILTKTGTQAVYTAVMAKGIKACCIAVPNMKIDEENNTMILGNYIYNEGDVISLDGETGNVYDGSLPVVDNYSWKDLSKQHLHKVYINNQPRK